MRLIFLLFLTLNLLNAQKIALLIGNSDYSFSPLKNPTHDVDGIAKTLKEIGFKSSDIKILKNASQSQMQKALANFSQKAKDAEIALIYFSGHGMQVNNINYMFPARTTATKPVDLFGLVDLNYFIQSATSAKYGIVLVDACRDNPLVKYFQNGKHKGSSAKKGLGQVTPTAGQVVIGFATSAGDTANDGNGYMSPYAKALSVRLKEPNKDITKVLGLVALDVSAKYEQNPIVRTNLAYDVYLNNKKTLNNVVVLKHMMWEDEIENKKLRLTYNEMYTYCSNLKLNGFSDWTVPSLKNLKKLYKNKNMFKYLTSGYYWSSDTNYGTGIMYPIFFNGTKEDDVSEFDTTVTNYIRCVREIKVN